MGIREGESLLKQKLLKQRTWFALDIVLVAIICVVLISIKTPEAVKGLSVTGTTYDSADITWTESQDADGYIIYRSVDGADFENIGRTEETEFKDTDLITGKTYSYSVAAYNGIKKRGADESTAVTAEPSLETPELNVSIKKGEIRLKITEVDGATGYEIYRDDEKIADQAELTFIDKEAANDEVHHYTAKAYREQTDPSADDSGIIEKVEKVATVEKAFAASSEDKQKEPEPAETFTAYSAMSEDIKVELVSVGSMKAEITGQDIVFTWEPSDKYSNYKLYQGKDLLTETEETEYTLTDFDPEEDYEMKLVGFTEDGKTKSPETVQTFEIDTEKMSNEEAIDAACEWGVKIADDDSFAYGECPQALHNGCYFCKTNGRKGKGYEKTYICNALVHACFAHGAADPKMLKACKEGHSVGMTEESYTRYGNWKNVSKPSKGSLKKGDVLVANKSIGESNFHHVALYLGDGKILEATRKGWSAESIAVRNLSSMYYDRYDFVMRYTGHGGGEKYTIEDVTEAEA